jgi:hypothetical protein
MRPRHALCAALLLAAACSDRGDATAPRALAAATHAALPADGTRDAALGDALARIAPVLGAGAEAHAVRDALRAATLRDGAAERAALLAAVERLAAARPELSPEADAIRLAALSR